MEELKHSALLSRLLANAKTVGEKNNGYVTAERFVVALLDEIDQTQEPGNGEFQAVRNYALDALIEPADARKVLMHYINQENSHSFLDDLFMRRRMMDAQALSQKCEASEINALTMFLCIVNEPSKTIESVLRRFEQKKQTEQTTQSLFETATKAFDEKAPEPEAETAAQDQKRTHSRVRGAKKEMADLVAEVKRIRTELQDVVLGQDNAVNVFAAGYFQASLLAMTDKSRTRPRATFLFAGPPGVGKTFMAERAAKALGLPFRRFDMSEYSDKEANLEFCGSDKVYKNGKAGNVTSFVAENPKCVLLFDEIEKAHLCVIHLFLQILDAGRLRDNYTDEEVSFRDAIIILTTNAGKQLYEESESGDLSTVSRKVIIRALETDVRPDTGTPYFPAAICSRFASGNVVMFNHISAHDLRTIAKMEIRRHAANLEAETGIKLQMDEQVYTALLFAEGSKADARTVRSRAETFFNDELYELLRLISSEKVKSNVETIEKIRVSVDLTHAKSEIAELFIAAETPRMLVFADGETVARCRSKVPEFEVVGVQALQAAVEAIKTREIHFVILDMRCGADEGARENLNLEDVDSPARDFFKFLREQGKGLPVYLLEDSRNAFSDEEMTSFLRQGVRGMLRFGRGQADFAFQARQIAENLHQQASMVKLARENKLVSFETAQTISPNGKNAQIKLFDLTMAVAVDAEDAKSILSAASRPNVRFADVIGAGDAKKELAYFVEYLKNPKKYMGTGVKAPKGVLLYGPPGTGKTMLAKAMACEADVTFIAAEGNQFLKQLVGQGPEQVHALFKTARKYAPAILFIDEIDAIAKERKGSSALASSGEETLTAFLTEMDGFASDPSKPVFVLAATNFDVEPGREKSLDPALMRRFDRRVYIDLPGKEDRIRFLNMKIAGNKALQISREQVDNIALRATGMSLAELDSVVELALRSAIREGSTTVTNAILEEAFETFNSGEAKSWDISQLERVARHEAGHALLCHLAGQSPAYITIVARGNHGGYVQHGEQEGKGIFTREELLDRIRTSLGGRAAEIVCYGPRDGISTGASGDLAAATHYAQQMVCTYGMDDDFGLSVVSGSMAANSTIALEIRTTVNRILREQMQEAIRLISENTEKLDALVSELMSKNHLTGQEIRQVLSR